MKSSGAAETLHRVPNGARVTIIRLRSLGDCVLTTPALAILKAHRPDLQIGVVVEDRFRAIFETNPDVADVLRPGIREVMNYGGELCLNLHGGTRSALLTAASRAPIRAGFGHFRHRAVYNVLIPRAQEILPSIGMSADAADTSGDRPCGSSLAPLTTIATRPAKFPASSADSGTSRESGTQWLVESVCATAADCGADSQSAAPRLISALSRPVHTAEHLASAMFYLGVPVCEIPRARLFAAPSDRPRPYAVFHPFASRPDKTWPAERFLEVARSLRSCVIPSPCEAGKESTRSPLPHGRGSVGSSALQSRARKEAGSGESARYRAAPVGSGISPVFIGGADDETNPFREFEIVANAPLSRVMSLISGAELFIGNDSGPAHIAAGFGVRTIVIFGASDPRIWGPWRTPSTVLFDPNGIQAIGSGAVLEAMMVNA